MYTYTDIHATHSGHTQIQINLKNIFKAAEDSTLSKNFTKSVTRKVAMRLRKEQRKKMLSCILI